MTTLHDLLDDAVGPVEAGFVVADVLTRARRRRHRRRAAIAGAAVVVAAIASTALLTRDGGDSGSDVRLGEPEETGLFSTGTDDVLVFDDGYDGVTAVDPERLVAARVPVEGQAAGDQPFRSIVVGDDLVVGWGDVYAWRLGAPRSRLIGEGVVLPAAEPGHVWLAPCCDGGPQTYRLVDMDGNVVLEGYRPPPETGGVAAVDGGLAFAQGGDISVWDARDDEIVRTFRGITAAQVGPAHGEILLSCTASCARMQLTDLASGVTREIQGGGDSPDMYDAVFSPDGRWLAVAVGVGADGAPQAVVLVDVAGARIVQTLSVSSYVTAAWSPDSTRLYVASNSYMRSEGTLTRIGVTTNAVERAKVPFGGLMSFHVMDRSSAAPLFAATETAASQCVPPTIQPSGRTEPCRFTFQPVPG
jgi:hypothetical protein